jgi:hypothetical protein
MNDLADIKCKHAINLPALLWARRWMTFPLKVLLLCLMRVDPCLISCNEFVKERWVILTWAHCTIRCIIIVKIQNRKWHTTQSHLKVHKITQKQAARSTVIPISSQSSLSPLISKTPFHHSCYNSSGIVETFGQHLIDFQSGNLKERDHLRNLVLKFILKKILSEQVGLIHLAQNVVRWQALRKKEFFYYLNDC